MTKTIFRVIKNPDNPFVMIDRRPIENPEMSWRAKGILTYLISRPDDWKVRLADLIKRSTDGDYAVRQAIRELRVNGHIRYNVIRDGNRITKWELEVHEIALPSELRDFQQVETQQVENQHLNNIDSFTDNKKDSKRKKRVLKSSEPSKSWEQKPYPDDCKILGMIFETLFGRRPLSYQEWNFWIVGSDKHQAKGLTHFVKVGITPDELKTAFTQCQQQRIPIKNPNTLFTFAYDIHRKNQGKVTTIDVLSSDQIEKLRQQAQEDFVQ